VRLHAARDDSLRQLTRVRLQGLDAARLERIHIVVVDRGGLGEDLLVRHDVEQLGLADAAGPLLAKLGAVVAQVCHQLLQARARVIVAVLRRPVVRRFLHFCFWSRSIGLVVHVVLL
jgi:hypothetical protein